VRIYDYNVLAELADIAVVSFKYYYVSCVIISQVANWLLTILLLLCILCKKSIGNEFV